MFALFTGLLAGPALGGVLSAAAGPSAAFAAAAGAVLLGALSALRARVAPRARA